MKKINYTIDNKNIITSWTRVPFDSTKPYIEVEDNVEIHKGYDKVINGVFIPDNAAYLAAVAANKVIEDRLLEIARLKKQLADTDYQCMKHADGVLTDEEYESIRLQRQAWRDEINELEGK